MTKSAIIKIKCGLRVEALVCSKLSGCMILEVVCYKFKEIFIVLFCLALETAVLFWVSNPGTLVEMCVSVAQINQQNVFKRSFELLGRK